MKRHHRGSGSKDLRGDIEHHALRDSGRSQQRSAATQSPYAQSLFPNTRSLGKSPPSNLAESSRHGTLALTNRPPATKKRRLTDHDNHPTQDIQQYRNASGSFVKGPGASSNSAINVDDSDHEQGQDDSPSISRSKAMRRQTQRHYNRPTSPLSSVPVSTFRTGLAVESDDDGEEADGRSTHQYGHTSPRSPSILVAASTSPPAAPSPFIQRHHSLQDTEEGDSSRDPLDLLDPEDRDQDTLTRLLPPKSPATSTMASRMAGKRPSHSSLGKTVSGTLREREAQQQTAPKRPATTQNKTICVSLDTVVVGHYVAPDNLEPRLDFNPSDRHMTLVWRGESGGPRSVKISAQAIARATIQSMDISPSPNDVFLLLMEIDPASPLAKTLESDFTGQYDSRSSTSKNIAIRSRRDTHNPSSWAHLINWLKSCLPASQSDISHIDVHAAKVIYDSEVKPVITAWNHRWEKAKQYLDSKEKDKVRAVMERRNNGPAALERPRPRPSLFKPQDPATRTGPVRLEMSTASENNKQTASSSSSSSLAPLQPAQPARPRPKPASAARNAAAGDDSDPGSFYDMSARPTRRSVAQGRASLYHDNKRPADSRTGSPSPPLSRPKRTTNSLLFDYPFEPPVSVSLFESDCDRLLDGEFLNDTILEFGLKYHLEQIRKRDPSLFDSLYVFNSFFYRQLTKFKNRPNEMYQQVRKWTSKTDIFAKRFLVIPINENLHWYLAVVLNPGKALQYVVDAEEGDGDKEAAAGNEDDKGSPAVTKDDECSNSARGSEVQTPTPPPDRDGGRGDEQEGKDVGVNGDGEEGKQLPDSVSASAASPAPEDDNDSAEDETSDTKPSAFKLLQMHRSRHPNYTSSHRRSATSSSRPDNAAGQADSGSSPEDTVMLSDSIVENLRLDSDGKAASLRGHRNQPSVPSQEVDDEERQAEELLTGDLMSSLDPHEAGGLSTASPHDGTTPSIISSTPSEFEVIDAVSNIKNAGRGRIEGGGPSSSSPGSTASAGSPKRQAMRIIPGESMRRYEESAAPPPVTSSSFYGSSPSASSTFRPRSAVAQYGSSNRKFSGVLGRGSPPQRLAIARDDDGERIRSVASAQAARKASGRQSTPVDVDSDPEVEPERRHDGRHSTGLNLPFSPSPSPPSISKPQAKHEDESRDAKASSEDKSATPPPPKPFSERKSQSIANHRQGLQDLCVITFDSLGGAHPSVKTQVTHYLRNEAKDKKQLTIEPKVRYLSVSVPEQKNFCDCGLFVLLYFERFFRDVDAFVDRIIPERDSKNDSWQAESAKTARQHWRTLIAELAAQWKEKRKGEEGDAANGGAGERGGSKEASDESGCRLNQQQVERKDKGAGADDDDDDDDFEIVS